MKNTILILICTFCLTLTAKAQETVSKVWIGGNIGIIFRNDEVTTMNSSSNPHDKVTKSVSYLNFSIVPEVGYKLNDELGVGLKLGFSKNETPFVGFGKEDLVKSNIYQAGAFLRYTAFEGTLGSIFLDGGFDYYYNKMTDKGKLPKKIDQRGFSIGLTPGVLFNLSEKFSLLTKFGFFGYKNSKRGDIKTKEGGLDLNFEECTIGIIYNIQ